MGKVIKNKHMLSVNQQISTFSSTELNRKFIMAVTLSILSIHICPNSWDLIYPYESINNSENEEML